MTHEIPSVIDDLEFQRITHYIMKTLSEAADLASHLFCPAERPWPDKKIMAGVRYTQAGSTLYGLRPDPISILPMAW